MAGDPIPAALGFRSHSGWTAVVCLGGPLRSPVVIERSRLLLTSSPLPREPYHLAKGRDPEVAAEIVRSASDEARALAAQRIADLRATAGAAGYEVLASGVVLGGGRPGFTLSQALSTHAAMHNAEGWLYREALMQAGESCDLLVVGSLEATVYEEAADSVGLSLPELETRINGLGRQLGPPWGKDQKLAAAVAWLALAQTSRPE